MFTGTKELRLNRFNTQVMIWTSSAQIWKLLPVKTEGPSARLRSSSEALDDGDPSVQSSTYAQHSESEYDELGTVVNEVTVVTTTVTTRRRYRVEDA
jgi:hypothetical protein